MTATLSETARAELREHLVPEAAIEAIALALPVIEAVCRRAGLEYDEDDGDDANLFGQQCSRRSRNLIGRDVQDAQIENTVVTYPKGSLDVVAGGTHLHFWAAGDDEGSPRLKGGKTKPAILDECLEQLRLWQEHPAEAPDHLVIAYRATPSARGVEKIVVGVPSSAETWQFGVKVYDRDVAVETESKKPAPRRFDADAGQQDAVVIRLRPEPKRDEQ